MTDGFRQAHLAGVRRHARLRRHFSTFTDAELLQAVVSEEASLGRVACRLLAAQSKLPWHQGLELAWRWWGEAIRPGPGSPRGQHAVLDRRLRRRTDCAQLGPQVHYLGTSEQIALMRVVRERALWTLAARLGRAMVAADDANRRVGRSVDQSPGDPGDASWRAMGGHDALDHAIDRHLTDIQPVRLPGLVGLSVLRYQRSRSVRRAHLEGVFHLHRSPHVGARCRHIPSAPEG